MKTTALLLLLLATPLAAGVVRPSPDFTWTDATGALKSSKAFRGRPLVLLIAGSPRDRAFRSQVGQLQKMYERLASEKVICVAAFSQTPGIVRSNIPFVLVPDGPQVSSNFGVAKGFAIAVIGRDGNLDSFGTKVLPVQRIHDILDNSFVVQKALRRP